MKAFFIFLSYKFSVKSSRFFIKIRYYFLNTFGYRGNRLATEKQLPNCPSPVILWVALGGAINNGTE